MTMISRYDGKKSHADDHSSISDEIHTDVFVCFFRRMFPDNSHLCQW